jgi:hypothetical protein
MARFRRESHHSDGITDQKILQRTSATKSGTKQTSDFSPAMSAFGGKADIAFEDQKVRF